MFQKAFSFAGTLLLAGAAALVMPGTSQAQHGGGHGGGGHFGGGMHFGGMGRHFGGGMHHDGIRHRIFPFGGGRYLPYYGGYSYYPYDGSDGDYDSYYDEPYPYSYPGPYGPSSPTYDSGYPNRDGDVAPDLGSGTASMGPAGASRQLPHPSSTGTPQPDTAAHVTVEAPADAQLWFNGTLTAATGTVRQFDSPPLAAGNYSYEIQARWHEGGKEVMQTQHVAVAPGARIKVDFPVQSQTGKK